MAPRREARNINPASFNFDENADLLTVSIPGKAWMIHKTVKSILKELPYHGVNILNCHGQFNNSLSDELPKKKYHEKLSRIHDSDLFTLNVRADINWHQSNKAFSYSFKIFPQFWLAKSTRIIHHNQLLMTKPGRILCLTRKWRQKCSLLQVNAPLTEKTTRRPTSAIWRIFAVLDKPKRALSKINLTSMRASMF